MPVIPAHEKLRQEDHDFKVSLGCVWRPCLTTNINENHLFQNKTKSL